jgi:hypothetical protein
LAEFDAALLAKYRESEVALQQFPLLERQQRFAEYSLFPHLGWGLVGALEVEAARAKDPGVLAAGLSRFVKCAHAVWGRADAEGLHPGGYDYCTLVVTAIYSSLLGPKYASQEFHAGRLLSRNGYPAYRHAANLMVCFENAGWAHRSQAEAAGRKFVQSKSASAVDSAFVETLLSALEGNRGNAHAAMARFADGYLKSDWGRQKPFTKSVFMRALATYCGRRLGGEALEVEGIAPNPPEGPTPWNGLRDLRDAGRLSEYQFVEPLEFLNSTSCT